MAAGYRGVIFLTAIVLVLISIGLAVMDQNTSNILIFSVIFLLVILILYWKLFNVESTKVDSKSSSPTISRQSKTASTILDGSIILSSEVQDPLDQELDIPLM